MSSTLARGLSPARTRLENGAVVTVQETSLTAAVTIHASFRSGSMLDPDPLPGLAYLTARVLDRGTERREADVIAEELDDRGVSLKIATNRHALALSCTCLAEDFDDILALVIDIVRRPVFPDEEIKRRRAEAVTALRQRADNPASRAADAALELIYSRSHPYGRPAKGTAEGVERVTRDDMVAFHHRRIRAAVLSLVIVGDIPQAQAVERAARELDGWNGDVPPAVDVPPPPPVSGRRQRVIAMPGKSQTDIVYGVPTVRRLDPRYYAYWMMNNVLGEFGLGGRLADNIRERQGMAYYAFSTLNPVPGEAPLLIRAGVDPGNVERAVAAIDHEVAALAADGPTATELEETRASLVGAIPRLLETNESIASFLQSSEEFGLGIDFDQRLPALLRDVGIEQVRAAAAEALVPDRAAVALAGPEAAGGQANGTTVSEPAAGGRR